VGHFIDLRHMPNLKNKREFPLVIQPIAAMCSSIQHSLDSPLAAVLQLQRRTAGRTARRVRASAPTKIRPPKPGIHSEKSAPVGISWPSPSGYSSITSTARQQMCRTTNQ
jgi:hypothetical protein